MIPGGWNIQREFSNTLLDPSLVEKLWRRKEMTTGECVIAAIECKSQR